MPVGTLDVAFYRDDIGLRPVAPLGPTEVPDITRPGRRARRRRAVHRPHGRAPRSTRCSSSAGPARCSSRCSSTAATASCRSAPTSSARTCRPACAEDVRVRLAEVDGGDDGVELWGPDDVKHLLVESTISASTCSSVDDLGPVARASRRCSTSPTRSSRCTRRDIPKVPALRGKTVVSLFYEDSTRTRLSFETAAKRLVGRHDDVLGRRRRR